MKIEKDAPRRTSKIDVTIVEDCAVSALAKAVYIFGVSKANGQIVDFEQLQDCFKEGTESIRKAIRLLERQGYLTRSETRENGRFAQAVYHWHTKPLGKKRAKRRYSTPKGIRGRDLCEHLAKQYGVGRLRGMPYEEYLKTEYWQQVRQLKHKNSAGRCEFCGSTDKLHIHHESYAHRGYEYAYLDDLAVVCEGCHQAIHGKAVSGDEES